MKIMIVSDSHRNKEALSYAVGQELPFNMLIHAGDLQGNIDAVFSPEYREYDVVCVQGNCDSALYPPDRLVTVSGDGWHRTIYVCHGHRYGVKDPYIGESRLLDAARQRYADIVIYGHTHIPVCRETEDGILVINPGSVSIPHQQPPEPSYAVLEIDDDGIATAEIRHLPDRFRW